MSEKIIKMKAVMLHLINFHKLLLPFFVYTYVSFSKLIKYLII